MINNRQQNGRRRGRGGNNGGNPGGPRQGGGRPDNGNRIDNRARGNAAQLLEKYKNLASDAQRQGDRVNTEYYLQFADHYFRVLADQRGRFEDQQPRRQQRDDFDIDGDDEFGDEGEPIRAGEQGNFEPQQQGQRRERDGRGRDGGGREGQQREYSAQRDGSDGEQPRQRKWEERPSRRRDAGQDREQPVEVAGQHRSDPVTADESLETRSETVLEADAPLPRRRGRPRRDAGTDGAATGVEAPAGNGVEADRLPPSLNLAANDAGDDAADEAPKPRRRRTRAASDVPTAAE